MSDNEQAPAKRTVLSERLTRLLHKAGKVPKPVDRAWTDVALANGLLSKAELRDGVYYFGICRNARVARWDAARSRFVYMRSKFGDTFPEDIHHPEDDDGFDLFLPVGEVAPCGSERVPE